MRSSILVLILIMTSCTQGNKTENIGMKASSPEQPAVNEQSIEEELASLPKYEYQKEEPLPKLNFEVVVENSGITIEQTVDLKQPWKAIVRNIFNSSEIEKKIESEGKSKITVTDLKPGNTYEVSFQTMEYFLGYKKTVTIPSVNMGTNE